MSHEHEGAHVVKASGGGGGWKWLAAAAAAAVVLGGGYYAWKSMGAPQTQTAYNEPSDFSSSSEPVHAGPLAQDQTQDQTQNQTATDQAPPVDETVAPPPSNRTAASTPTRRSTATRSTPTRTARAEPVPEETVGVTLASATTDEEAVIVQGHRRPVWVRSPSASRLSDLYPARALERRRDGEATVNCTVEQGGRLDCVKASEYPLNSGFGTAALRVAHMFRHAPQRADGSSAIGTPVNLHVVFRMGDEDRG